MATENAKEFLKKYKKENGEDELALFLEDISFLDGEGVNATGIFKYLQEQNVKCSYKQVLNRLRRLEKQKDKIVIQKAEAPKEKIEAPKIKKSIVESLSEDFDLMSAATPKIYTK